MALPFDEFTYEYGIINESNEPIYLHEICSKRKRNARFVLLRVCVSVSMCLSSKSAKDSILNCMGSSLKLKSGK